MWTQKLLWEPILKLASRLQSYYFALSFLKKNVRKKKVDCSLINRLKLRNRQSTPAYQIFKTIPFQMDDSWFLQEYNQSLNVYVIILSIIKTYFR